MPTSAPASLNVLDIANEALESHYNELAGIGDDDDDEDEEEEEEGHPAAAAAADDSSTTDSVRDIKRELAATSSEDEDAFLHIASVKSLRSGKGSSAATMASEKNLAQVKKEASVGAFEEESSSASLFKCDICCLIIPTDEAADHFLEYHVD